MTNLVTGASGFIGRYLVEHLQKAYPNENVITLTKHPLPAGSSGRHFICDMTDEKALTNVLAEVNPGRIYHLAGVSRVGQELPEHFQHNFVTSATLLRAIGVLKGPVKLFLTSSVHVYGNQGGVITEESPAKPVSAYGFCKFIAEESARQAVKQFPHLQVVVGRLYNCIGPGQGEGFVVSDLASRLVEIESGKERTLKTGSLKAFRQFIDVRDLVELLPRLMATELPSRFEVFNIASGQGWQIGEIVEILLKEAGRNVPVQSNEGLAPNPFTGLTLDTKRLESLLKPRYRPLEQTLRDILLEKRKGSHELN